MTSILLLILGSVYVNFKIIRDKKFIEKTERVSVIYDGCYTDHLQRINYNLFGMIRRVLLVMMLVMLGNYPNAQIVFYLF